MRILYLYPHAACDEIARVAAGQSPRDRLYGLAELREYGHHVDVADSRFEGRAGDIVRRLRHHGVYVSDLATFARLREYDVVVVKDNFSTTLSLTARALGARIVYVDSLFQFPRRAWKHALNRCNLSLAHGLVAYSRTQIAQWAERYEMPVDRFTFLPYTIDTSFYRPAPPTGTSRPYVLSVGRDMGRSFETLVRAMDGLGLDLKLVTLPHLLRGVRPDLPWIEVLQHVPYETLFRLYADARLVVVPLKDGITYPSGVRGVLESMALGRAVVSTRTKVLEEYAGDGEGVLYVEPNDTAQMRAAIARLHGDDVLREEVAARGAEIARTRYNMGVFAHGLEALLTDVVSGRAPGRSH